jgi:hypothetical protein
VLPLVKGHGMHWTDDAFVVVIALLALELLQILRLIFFASFWLLKPECNCPAQDNRGRHHRLVFLVT